MRYLDLLWALDLLCRYYPKYHSHELFLLADDIWKWLNNELPEDSSALIYLKSCYNSPTEALTAIWKEVQLIADSFTTFRKN